MKTKKEKITLTVNQAEMLTILKGISEFTLIHLYLVTLVDMLKGGRDNLNDLYNGVLKHQKRSYLTCKSYKTRKQNEQIKRGELPDFEPVKPYGKHHIEGSDCVLQSDTDPNVYYLMVEYFERIKAPKPEYFKLDGSSISKAFFEAYLKKRGESDVKVITPKISNIKAFSLNGVRYLVE